MLVDVTVNNMEENFQEFVPITSKNSASAFKSNRGYMCIVQCTIYTIQYMLKKYFFLLFAFCMLFCVKCSFDEIIHIYWATGLYSQQVTRAALPPDILTYFKIIHFKVTLQAKILSILTCTLTYSAQHYLEKNV